ncbi:preprotein translocase subunit SecE [Leptotrichia hofstadii]|uniref:Preprotein translocase, SecE subunit n=2 Tax=Leptotrichia hofstadii TaxID=157688 RepID=C9MYZ7_9FUSO|nr:preprotein translocase subunit SecE [Leptotrichia hofstadii]EEX74152.1 preprotein translocase, SecE subunit [Leptotrichia hofstadii F0254]BBM37785.1 preprotein translocase subunit SecE [Leptotrichia hofstadii]
MSKFNLKEVFGNLREEYKKIYWPDKIEVYHVTVIVILMTAFIALYTVLFDTAFNFVLAKISDALRNILGGA